MLKLKKLNIQEENIILNKGTEAPFTGEYDNFYEKGIYACKHCGTSLFLSEQKFKSSCGWPSFDDEIPGKVKKEADADGRRIEILCNKCGGHLGHIFEGENYTEKNQRYCVNSVSIDFLSEDELRNNYKAIYFGGGCFWGIQHYLDELQGVILTEAGYSGGNIAKPTYEQVCTGDTNHAEVVKLVYNPEIVSLNELLDLFFKIHNPTQMNRQGPDIGTQYRSVIYFSDSEQEKIINIYLAGLIASDIDIKTECEILKEFFIAEEYHQHYYIKKDIFPQCGS